MMQLPTERMDQMLKRFDLIEARMAAGPAPDEYVKLASEYSELQEIAGAIKALRAAQKERADLEAMLADRSTDAEDRKSTRLNSSHVKISYAVFCLKKKKKNIR